MIQKRTTKVILTQEEIGSLFLLGAIIFGAWFRFYPVIEAGFPINDGGLFFTMTKAIQSQSYALPKYVSYNGLDIPFTYPPLAFFVTGLIQDTFKIPLLDLFRWLPALFATLTIPAVFLLARSFLNSPIEAGIAAFFYALLPRTITWLVMGGGITRSLGQLFLTLAVYYIYNLFNINTKKYLLGAIIFSSLVCLSHPEAALHTIGIALLLFVFNWRKVSTWINAGLTGLGTLFLTSVWWLPSLLRHGLDPFLSASQTGAQNPFAILHFLIFPVSEEPLATTLFVLAMIGAVVQLTKREYLLPLFFIVPAILEPRNAATVVTIPMAFLASVTVCRLLLPSLARLHGIDLQFYKTLSTKAEKILLGYLVIVLFLGIQYYGILLSNRHVSEENLQAFKWISANTSPKSKFIIVTGNTELFTDGTQEWFPVLSGRISLTTIQGQEWVSKNNFFKKSEKLQAIQSCNYKSDPYGCIEKQLSESFPFEYVYITTADPGMIYTDTTSMPLNTGVLIMSLLQNEKYTLLYRTNDVAIFSYSNSTPSGDDY